MATIIKKENGSVVFQGLKGQYQNRQFAIGAVSLKANGTTFDVREYGQLVFSFNFSEIQYTQIEPAESIAVPETASELLLLLQTDFFFDNSAGGGGGGVTPLFYAATLSQSLTFAPVANKVTTATITADITYARAATGVYTVTADAPAFTTGKTFVTLTNGGGFSAFYSYEFTSETVITIRTFDGTTGLPADGVMNGASFKVEVYP